MNERSEQSESLKSASDSSRSLASSWLHIARDDWKHLRLPFQMTLAPLFLWGAFLSGAPLSWRLLPAFVAFHAFLYTGITAYNSYYDRDEGPIGGLEHPPPVHPSLLPLGWAMQGLGLLLALLSGASLPFTAIYLVFVVLGILYSHPRPRWKANPWLSALVVCGGQGGLGFLAGWAAARGEIASAASLPGLLGGLSAALTTLGMYPLTQVYQMEEDAGRGDRTLCVVLGAQGGLRLSQAALGGAGVAAGALAVRFYTLWDAAVLIGAYGGLIGAVEWFRINYASLSHRKAFRTVLGLSYGASSAFLLFIMVRLLLRR